MTLSATAVSKSYGGVRVLDGVDFTVDAGEIHALVGENGAGKSTLIKVLSGAVVPDAGSVSLAGQPVTAGDPPAARRRGIAVVYQEFTLVPELSVADNIFLGRERGRPFLRRAETLAAARRQLDAVGLDVDPATPVGQLTVARQQLVEITRALTGDAKVLILDEPSASLAAHDVTRLLDTLRRLRAQGLAIVYVSHRFEEVFAIADRVTVLRDGAVVAVKPAAGLDRAQVIRWMVGRDVSEEFPVRSPQPGAALLEVAHLSCAPRFSDVSFTVRAGEIVGLGGLVGAGRTSAALAIFGALKPTAGMLRVAGRRITFRSPAHAMASGVAYVTEDRKARGLFPQMSTSANITIAHLKALTRAGLLDVGRERAAASAAARDFDVRAASLSQPAGTLSGGNQQKLMLARALLDRRALVILDEPTRGVDVGARAEIYALMNRLTAAGLAILMISSDLPELLGMSDRIVVMRDGRTSGELPRARATAEAVMALAAPA